MPFHARSLRRQALFDLAFAALVTALCAALIAAAALVPAPPAVLPLVVLVGMGCPMAAAFELHTAVAALRSPAAHHRRALARLRRHLDELPETQHPLGL